MLNVCFNGFCFIFEIGVLYDRLLTEDYSFMLVIRGGNDKRTYYDILVNMKKEKMH